MPVRQTQTGVLSVPARGVQAGDIESLQTLGSAHASIHNHFNLECTLASHETFKQNRYTALADRWEIAA